ncbi:hypothetical protein [Hahella ganghwensis]|uniref:hypothetical protein n=1 Tax=Hahella ganghwensis TaxID=286420 RepID=UPI00035D3AED|nr:hypothetical protein [Hahella ganghwensis]
MQFLRRLKASKMNPLGPDIANAPWMTFNLSGTELRFRCPPHEMTAEMKVAPETLNIYQDDIYESWNTVESIGMSVNLVATGWDFRDNPFGDGLIGYLMHDIQLQRRHPHYRKVDTLFNPVDTKAWILRHCDGVWGDMNRDLWENRENYDTTIDPEQHFWRYPKSADEICREVIHGREWYGCTIEKPNGPKRRLWSIPISDDHVLMLHFQPSAQNREYYEPDHDLDGAVEKTIQEFMSHVHVKLAPDAQQRYEEVMAEVSQAK